MTGRDVLIGSAIAVGIASVGGVTLLACGYGEGEYRNVKEVTAIIRHLRTDCTRIGLGVDSGHMGTLIKSEIFQCPDGSLGFVPMAAGE